MKKSTVLWLTIISTIFSLIFILGSYFGITRYLSLHVSCPEKFIKNYSKLSTMNDVLPEPKFSRIVVSFTTTKKRLNKIKPMINSLLDQTIKVDAIYVTVKGKNYTLPKYLKDVAIVLPIGRYCGKGTNIMTPLLREKECDTVIIGLDDNVVYGQDFIYSILDESQAHPDCVIIDNKNTAILVKPEFFGCDVVNREKENIDDKWFLEKANESKIFVYGENYRAI